jgi:acylglycerol lipase
MQQREGYFKGTDNLNLYWQCWLPDGKPRAVILVAIGLAEHISRYGNLVDHLVPKGYAVYGLDHQGHGRSEGKRVFVKRFHVFLDDLKTFYDMVCKENPGLKVIMMGHSMGGLIATAYTLEHQPELAALVVSAPLLKAGESVSPATISMARILSAITPRMGVQALDSTYLSHDKSVVEAYDHDPLVYRGKITARLGSEMFTAMDAVDRKLSSITLPLLVMQGSDDKLVSHEGSRLLYEKAASKDKTIRVYEGLYHEIFNEPERDKVFADLDAWLDSRF